MKSAQVARVSLDEPLEPIAPRAGAERVVVVVRASGGVVGELVLDGHGVVTAEALAAAIQRELGPTLWRRAAADAFKRAARGGPQSRSSRAAHVSVLVCAGGAAGDRDGCLASLARLNTSPREIVVAAGRPVAPDGELVALIDDDCVADPAWLDDLDRDFADPLVAAMTGYVGPLALDTPAQLRAWERARARGPLEPDVIDATSPQAAPALQAGPLVARRSALEAGLLGRPAKDWLAAGWRIAIDPARIVWRRHPVGQVTTATRLDAQVTRGARDPSAESVRVVDPADPALSVAIASYNRREALGEVLDGLAGQSYPAERFEVVVVLDGSTDGSAEMVTAMQTPYRIRLVEQGNQGLAATRNRGAHEAANPIVVFFDDDTVPEPDLLSEHAAAHRRSPADHVALSYCPPEVGDRDLWSLSVRAWWEDHYRRKATPDHVWSFLDVADAMSSAPRELFLSTGGFDEDFRGRKQDWEWGIRLLERDVGFAYYPQARGVHRLDTRLATALRNSREEGRNDVQLARKHPHVQGRLLLARFAPRPEGGRQARRRLALDHPRAARRAASAGTAALGALEWAGRVRAWRKLVDLLRSHAYLAGVADALGSRERVAEFLATPAAHGPGELLGIELSAPGRLAISHTNLPLELELAWQGNPLARIPAFEPGEQWDWEAVSGRAADAAGEPLRALLGPELGGLPRLSAP